MIPRYEGALFLEQTSKTLSEKGDVKLSTQLADEAAALYERALGGFMKKNMLLHFAFADFEETRMKHPKVHQVRKGSPMARHKWNFDLYLIMLLICFR